MSAEVSAEPVTVPPSDISGTVTQHPNDQTEDAELAAALHSAKLNATASKQATSRPTTTQTKQHQCSRCNKLISGQYVLANQQYYDIHCFQCHTCQKLLAGESYLIGSDNNTYCETDYYALFNPKCATCNEVIVGSYLSALGNKYHTQCFTCHICAQPFIDNAFHTHENKPYCDTHYNELFAVKCYKCNLPINDSVFEALGHSYHSACFTCAYNEHTMEAGKAFHVKDDKVYCQQHYSELVCDKCSVCDKPMLDSYIRIGDLQMHSACWQCEQCHTVLKSDNATTIAKKFYCRPCGIEIQQSRRSSATGSKPGSSVATQRPSSRLSTILANDTDSQSSSAVHKPTSDVPTTATDNDTTSAPPTDTKPAVDTKPATTSTDKTIKSPKSTATTGIKSPKPAPISTIKSPKADAIKSPKTKTELKSPKPIAIKPPYSDPTTTKYTLIELLNTDSKLKDVDPTKREQYLSDTEFKTVFNMTPAQFAKLPAWKQRMAKKDKHLF